MKIQTIDQTMTLINFQQPKYAVELHFSGRMTLPMKHNPAGVKPGSARLWFKNKRLEYRSEPIGSNGALEADIVWQKKGQQRNAPAPFRPFQYRTLVLRQPCWWRLRARHSAEKKPGAATAQLPPSASLLPQAFLHNFRDEGRYGFSSGNLQKQKLRSRPVSLVSPDAI
ncbi:hypothetical protein [Allorhizobium undicola]|uniref:hypothetical protein n=1 Tax=Allorhizobium undicola TaxID=78527 RepID=UPI0004850823|nr:hypothetical protein [Allorhizobium undicola]